jgi:hypothetical protein
MTFSFVIFLETTSLSSTMIGKNSHTQHRELTLALRLYHTCLKDGTCRLYTCLSLKFKFLYLRIKLRALDGAEIFEISSL